MTTPRAVPSADSGSGPVRAACAPYGILGSDDCPHDRRAGHARLRAQRGRLRGAGGAAGGRRVLPGRRPCRRGDRRGQHLRLRRAGQEGQRRHAPRRCRPEGHLRHPGRGRGRLPRGAVRRPARDVAARGRRGARLRRLPRHRRPAARHPRRRDAPPPHAAGPAQAPADLTRRPGRGRRRRGARPRPIGGRAGRDHRGRSACHRATHRPAPARRRADGPAQAGQRVRPALLVLRDPELPRLVRLPTADGRARRGALAGRAGRARAVPGERELHVLRQGPR